MDELNLTPDWMKAPVKNYDRHPGDSGERKFGSGPRPPRDRQGAPQGDRQGAPRGERFTRLTAAEAAEAKRAAAVRRAQQDFDRDEADDDEEL